MLTHGSTDASHGKCKYFKKCYMSNKTTKSRSVRPILPSSSLALPQAILPFPPGAKDQRARGSGRLVTFLFVERGCGLVGRDNVDNLGGQDMEEGKMFLRRAIACLSSSSQ